MGWEGGEKGFSFLCVELVEGVLFGFVVGFGV